MPFYFAFSRLAAIESDVFIGCGWYMWVNWHLTNESFDVILDYHCNSCGMLWQRTGETSLKIEEKSLV